ncbi:MAG: hypothetical protein ACREAA_18250 [Candidatus Polarisedimenticolia bacterium]
MLVIPAELSGVALAYRPFDGTDAAVVDPREIEIEVGPLGFLDDEGEEYLVGPAVVVNWGIAPEWEVVVEGTGVFPRDTGEDEHRFRFEDTAALLKGVLRSGALQDAAGASLAVEGGFLLPTVHGESGMGASAALIVSWRLGRAMLHLNAEAERSRAGKPGLFTGAIVEGPDSWWVRPVGEVSLQGESGDGSVRSVLIGLIARAGGRLTFDAAVRLERGGKFRGHELRAGFTVVLPQ